MIVTHTLKLVNNITDREVHVVSGVPSIGLIGAFTRMCERAEEIASPTIFVDGRGYTSRRDFISMVNTVNEVSESCGGARVFA